MRIAIDTENVTVLLDVNKSHWMKSCPRCSRKAGVVVFKIYPEAFGASEPRGGPHSGAQSFCYECRRDKEPDE